MPPTPLLTRPPTLPLPLTPLLTPLLLRPLTPPLPLPTPLLLLPKPLPKLPTPLLTRPTLLKKSKTNNRFAIVEKTAGNGGFFLGTLDRTNL